ncbi:formate dehydrogenase subunit delta [Mesorhizobium sp. ES1-1]|uniref:formate dehydrogenase subunit delta n=1 Tax=Mesorhizobium sp. ES1-1 TaxID=2876629 RepID=UPI001CCEAF3C|nr:formate dehydrogenase subunit delta [Mesorhizobium sp. ES1-1]MBZ9678171.1 formate dehydrogenase subunit delta [Mesorhizobium sp. ES1-1]
MSHDEDHIMSTKEKLVRMANQIGTFFQSKPREEGIAGTAEHINKFWEPRMRQQFFEMLDAGGEGFIEIVVAASAKIRRPNAPEGVGLGAGADVERGAPGGKGVAAGESLSEIAASQK